MPAILKNDKQLSEHSDRLDKIETAIVAFRSFTLTNEQAVSHLTKSVCGNGLPGLDEQARKNKDMIENHTKELNELRVEVRDLIKQFQPVFIFYKVGVWGGTILGASVIALIWGIITHKVSIGVP